MKSDSGGFAFPWQWLAVMPYVYALWAVQWVLDRVLEWFGTLF